MKNENDDYEVLPKDGLTAAAAVVVMCLAFVVGLLLCVLFLDGCGAGVPPEFPCDTRSLASVTALCKRHVARACDKDQSGVTLESCVALIECDKLIDEWEGCTQSGAEVVELASDAQRKATR